MSDEHKLLRQRIQDELGPAPERWKPIEDYTAADHIARRRGERVESEHYREYERKLRDVGGLERPDADQSPDEMSVHDHAARKYAA